MGNVTYVILLLVFIFREITADEECLVTVKQGQLRGVKKTSVYNKTYCAFYGIPYAKPPVGEKRFKLAEPAEAWNGTYNATKEKSYCPQVSMSTHGFVGDEDCLYMNVYTNKLPKGNEKRNATIFSIHGGGFIGGTAGTYEYGPDYFLNADVLLVTIQYRLGILGRVS
ncbi:Esterase SG1 [Blattella germanica]|nr:Esterase SG1 [Blattella germanica]